MEFLCRFRPARLQRIPRLCGAHQFHDRGRLDPVEHAAPRLANHLPGSRFGPDPHVLFRRGGLQCHQRVQSGGGRRGLVGSVRRRDHRQYHHRRRRPVHRQHLPKHRGDQQRGADHHAGHDVVVQSGHELDGGTGAVAGQRHRSGAHHLRLGQRHAGQHPGAGGLGRRDPRERGGRFKPQFRRDFLWRRAHHQWLRADGSSLHRGEQHRGTAPQPRERIEHHRRFADRQWVGTRPVGHGGLDLAELRGAEQRDQCVERGRLGLDGDLQLLGFRLRRGFHPPLPGCRHLHSVPHLRALAHSRGGDRVRRRPGLQPRRAARPRLPDG